MHSKLLTVILMVLMSVMLVMAQNLNLATHGVTPREADADSTDIFDRAYSSLLNVGVETQMYLRAFLVDSTIGDLTWSVTGPEGSTAAFTNETALDSANKVAIFTPDLEGTYTVEVTDGVETASLVINAGTYMGIADAGCNFCHSGIHTEWKDTGHSSMLQRGLDGVLSSHYGPNCISCHTVGYDANADNNGFDDRTFVFPDTLYPGVYAATVAQYPDAMKLANIQCESCHGPGSAHVANGPDISDSKMVKSNDVHVCAICHDSGSHHFRPYQWKLSRHGNPETLSRGTRESCAPCHSGSGFQAWAKNGKTLDGVELPAPEPIGCAICHEPHSVANEHQVRLVDDVVLGNGVVISQGGTGKLCMNCHMGRRDTPNYTGTSGPHHGPQTDLLAGENAYTFGKTLPSSPHLSATENACADCHMAAAHADAVPTSGDHTFSMVDINGVDNVAACEPCHGHVASFDEKKYYFQGNADHDGDGVDEGLQEEIHGLLEELAMMLPPVGSTDVDLRNNPYTETERKAAFNYLYVEEDRSGGVHNPAFAVALLKVSMQAIMNNTLEGEIVAIEDVPNDQGKQVRIVWDAMVDDGIANDPLAKYFIQRFDDDSTVWTTVGEATATGSARYAMVAPTLYDTTVTEGMVLTTFRIMALAQSGMTYLSQEAQGWSADNLAPAAPQNLKATVGASAVALSWDESEDADFNYFAVYRSTEQGFDPAGMTPIATLTENAYNDAEVTSGQTYYYKVSAIDFAGNESDYSAEETVSSIGVGADSDIPSDFVLAQNYPNPFNPSTTVRFGLPQAESVKIIIYNVLGEPVRTLADGNFAAGYHKVTWDGRNNRGHVVSAGMYIYRMESPSTTMSQKMLFIK